MASSVASAVMVSQPSASRIHRRALRPSSSRAPQAVQGAAAWWLLATALMLLASYAMIMLSTTTIDAEGIAQTGLPERRVRWQDIDFAQVAGWPLARRLRVRTVAGKRVVFGGSGAALLAAFERIAAAHPRR